MNYKITYPGHAGVLFESSVGNFFCDPWLVGGAVNNSTVWLYPPRRMAISDLPKLEFIYISHDHEDHCNIATLEMIDKETRIYILNFPGNNGNLKNILDKLKFSNVCELEPFQRFAHNENFAITIYPSETGYFDSSALLECNNIKLYHGNDNTVSMDTLAEIEKNNKIDFAFLPYAGFSGYPACYEFSKELKDKYAKNKKEEAVNEFFDSIEYLKPRFAIPAAGDLCLVGEDVAWINYYDRATPDEIYEIAVNRKIQDKILPMKAGDFYSSDDGFVRHSMREEWRYNTEDQIKFARLPDVAREIEQYNKWLYSATNNNFKNDLIAYLKKGLTEFHEIATEVGPYIFLINVIGRNQFSISINFEDQSISTNHVSHYSKKIQCREEVLMRIVEKEFLWADAYSSGKFSLDRNPTDFYNKKFWIWLYSLDGMPSIYN